MEPRNSTRFGWLLASIEVALVLLLAGSAAAHGGGSQETFRLAYIDPATGSLIIQAVLGTLAAIAVATRIYWAKIKGWLGFATAKQADDGDLAPGASQETPPKDG